MFDNSRGTLSASAFVPSANAQVRKAPVAKPRHFFAPSKFMSGDALSIKESPPTRGGDRFQLQTQAVLNPFGVTRNPLGEKEFDQLLESLKPLMGQAPEGSKKETLKRLILKGNDLLEVSLNSQQKPLALYQLTKPTSSSRYTFECFQPVDIAPDKCELSPQEWIKLPGYAIQGMLILGIYRGPQEALNAASEISQFAGQSVLNAANEKLKAPAFVLKALKSNQTDLLADFEALHFSDAEKKKMAQTARKFSRDTSTPAGMSAYTEKTLLPFHSMAKILRENAHRGPLRPGLMYHRNPGNTPAENIEDLTHMLQWKKAQINFT